jgi:hypothetical protein
LPKYLSDPDANRLRAEGKAKHLPEASRKLKDEGPDPHAELHKATVAAIDRLAEGQEQLAESIAAGRRSQIEITEKIIAAGKPLPQAPPAPKVEPRIRRWEFEFELDEDGRIKRVVAQA